MVLPRACCFIAAVIEAQAACHAVCRADACVPEYDGARCPIKDVQTRRGIKCDAVACPHPRNTRSSSPPVTAGRATDAARRSTPAKLPVSLVSARRWTGAFTTAATKPGRRSDETPNAVRPRLRLGRAWTCRGNIVAARGPDPEARTKCICVRCRLVAPHRGEEGWHESPSLAVGSSRRAVHRLGIRRRYDETTRRARDRTPHAAGHDTAGKATDCRGEGRGGRDNGRERRRRRAIVESVFRPRGRAGPDGLRPRRPPGPGKSRPRRRCRASPHPLPGSGRRDVAFCGVKGKGAMRPSALSVA